MYFQKPTRIEFQSKTMDRRPPRRKVQQKQRTEEEIAIDILRRGDLWFHRWEPRENMIDTWTKTKRFLWILDLWGVHIFIEYIYIHIYIYSSHIFVVEATGMKQLYAFQVWACKQKHSCPFYLQYYLYCCLGYPLFLPQTMVYSSGVDFSPEKAFDLIW